MFDWGNSLKNRFGTPTGNANERQMFDKVGNANDPRTVVRTLPDGTAVMMKTGGGFVRTLATREPSQTYVAEYVSCGVGTTVGDDKNYTLKGTAAAFTEVYAYSSANQAASMRYIGKGYSTTFVLQGLWVTNMNVGKGYFFSYTVVGMKPVPGVGFETAAFTHIGDSLYEEQINYPNTKAGRHCHEFPITVTHGDGADNQMFVAYRVNKYDAGYSADDNNTGVIAAYGTTTGLVTKKEWDSPVSDAYQIDTPNVQRVGKTTLVAFVPRVCKYSAANYDDKVPFFSISTDNGTTWTDVTDTALFPVIQQFGSALGNTGTSWNIWRELVSVMCNSFVATATKNGVIYGLFRYIEYSGYLYSPERWVFTETWKLLQLSPASVSVVSTLPHTAETMHYLGGSADAGPYVNATGNDYVWRVPRVTAKTKSAYVFDDGVTKRFSTAASTVTACGSKFVFQLVNGHETKLYTSIDGLSWTTTTLNWTYNASGAITRYNATTLLAPVYLSDETGSSWRLLKSTDDGTTWTHVSVLKSGNTRRFQAVFVSTDPTNGKPASPTIGAEWLSTKDYV